MPSSRHFDWSYLLLCPFFADALIPWLKYRVQFRFVFPLVLVWFGFALSTRRSLELPREVTKCLAGTVLFFSLYQGLGLIVLPLGHGDGLSYQEFVDYAISISSLLVFHLSIRNRKMAELRYIVVFAFLCIAVAALMSITGESIVEGGSRTLTGSGDVAEIMAAREVGIGGYGFVYSMGLLALPVLFFARFMSLPMKSFCICLTGLIVMAVYGAGYTILIVGMVFGLMLYLLTKAGVRLRQLKRIGVVAVVVLVAVVTNPRVLGFAGGSFQWMADHTGKKEYAYRLKSLGDAVSGSEQSYAVDRSERYWTSWGTFLEKPFLGVGKYDWNTSDSMRVYSVGGHSLVFDLLACYGLLGMSIFLCFLALHHRYMRAMSAAAGGHKWWPGYYIFMFPATAIAFVNPLSGYMLYSILFLLIPGSTCLFLQSSMDLSRRSAPAGGGAGKHAV